MDQLQGDLNALLEEEGQSYVTKERLIQVLTHVMEALRVKDESQAKIKKLEDIMGYCCFDVPNNEREARRLLNIALGFEMRSLVKKCQDVLIGLLSIKNCIPNFKMAASKEELKELKAKAQAYIVEHFKSVSKDEEKLGSLSFDEAFQILNSDDLDMGEYEIFDIMVLWVKEDLQNRKLQIAELAKVIRLPLCDMRFLKSITEHYLLHDCTVLQKEVKKIMKMVQNEDPKLAGMKDQHKRKYGTGP